MELLRYYLKTNDNEAKIIVVTDIDVRAFMEDSNRKNEFEKTLANLRNTKGLIIDLRNTVDGGNSYVARGIMSRFINESKPYQKHWTTE